LQAIVVFTASHYSHTKNLANAHSVRIFRAQVIRYMKNIKFYIPLIGLSAMIKKYGGEDITVEDLAVDNRFWISAVIQGASLCGIIMIMLRIVS